MTDAQKLLSQYAKQGSEIAFRELVDRYVNLVYGTALRLLDGDIQLAEDVSQVVFIGLARNAGALSREVMLGGWLYRHTYHVAAKTLRHQYRRQAREREAVEMNILMEDPEETARRVRPILDEALMQLGNQDRKAILLRFFEQQDFRTVGATLNVSEDAARMRVSRALDKLRRILSERGSVLPAAGLGAALSAEGVKAAPVTLAAKLASAALTAAAGGGVIHGALVSFMNATKIKIGVAAAIISTSVATCFVLQQHAAARLRDADDSLRRDADQSAKLAADNDRLSNILANPPKNQLNELNKLRADAIALRQKTNELASLHEEQRRLRRQLQSQPKTPEEAALARLHMMDFAHAWLQAFRLFEDAYNRAPSGFDEAAPFLPQSSDYATDPIRDNFEWVFQLPDTVDLTNIHNILVIREIDPSLESDGSWTKYYGFADGSGQVVTMPSTWNGVTYYDFQSYENDRIATPRGK
jgi:RNA polymerase sigma factor (sigma-70 family)